MVDTLKEHDFIEIEYTGKLADGKIFDTTEESVAKANGIFNPKMKYEAFKLCVGEKQILPGLDATLIGKKVGNSYSAELEPEQAFGKKDIKKIQLVPIAAFKEHDMMPRPGLQVDFDGKVGTIMKVDGGRVMVNFNHALAGKTVIYDIKIIKQVSDKSEQIASYLGNVFRQIKDLGKIEVNGDKAEVKMPFKLPEQLTTGICKKLIELTGLAEVKFTIDEEAAKVHQEKLQKLAQEQHEHAHEHGPNCDHH